MKKPFLDGSQNIGQNRNYHNPHQAESLPLGLIAVREETSKTCFLTANQNGDESPPLDWWHNCERVNGPSDAETSYKKRSLGPRRRKTWPPPEGVKPRRNRSQKAHPEEGNPAQIGEKRSRRKQKKSDGHQIGHRHFCSPLEKFNLHIIYIHPIFIR